MYLIKNQNRRSRQTSAGNCATPFARLKNASAGMMNVALGTASLLLAATMAMALLPARADAQTTQQTTDWTNNCNGCHGSLASLSARINAAAAVAGSSNAIAARAVITAARSGVPSMASITTNTTTIDSITGYIEAKYATESKTVNTNYNTSTGAVSLTGNVMLGTAIAAFTTIQTVTAPSCVSTLTYNSVAGAESFTYVPGTCAAGAYTFTYKARNAGNTLSSGTKTVTLNVIAVVPSAPTIGTATPGNGQVSVAFSASASNGGSAITSYTATSSPGGFTGSCAASPCTVSGLTNGTAYTFTVKANNVAGASPASSASGSVTPRTVPGAPTIGTPTPGNTQVSVAFTAPASNGGSAITSYTATSSPGGFTGTCASSPCTVTGLTNGTAYTFTVTATNIAGTGSASAASSSATPRTVPGAPTIGTATLGNAQATVAFTAPGSNGGSAITSYTATSSPGGFTGSCASSPCTVTGLTNGTAYTFTVAANNAAGTGASSAASNSVTPRTVPGAPTIGTATAGNLQASVAFTAPASNGGSAITSYTATASPGGATGTCTAPCTSINVTGLTNFTAYTFTVTATNAAGTSVASSASNSATPVPTPVAPTFTSVSTTTFTVGSAGTFTLTASGTPVAMTFSLSAGSLPSGVTLSAAGSLSGTPAAGTVGSYPVTFKADNTTPPAALQSFTLTVAGTPQTISFTGPATQTYGAAPISVAATATSGLTVAFSTVPAVSSVCSVSGTTVTLLSAGSCTIAANQAGNTTFAAAAQITQVFTINQATQAALTANAVATSVPFGGTTTLSTSGGSGTGAVSYASNNGNCTIVGTTLTAAGVGSCIVTATKAADTNYLVTTGTVGITITVATQAALTANAAPTTINFGGTSTLSTSGGSGAGAVSYAVTTNPGNCSVVGTTLTGIGAGTCVVTATKAADGNYNAITGTVGVTVNATVAGAPTIGTATAGSGQASIAFTPPASDGGSAITSYTATCSPGALTGSNTVSPITVGNLANNTLYSCKVVANNAVGPSATSLPATVTPFSQGPTLWTNICSGCHGSSPAGNRFNAAGNTGTVLDYVRLSQPAMASITEIQNLTATDLADIAAYILQSMPAISVSTRYNTAKTVDVSSQITLNTIAFTAIQITGSPANGMLSTPNGTTVVYTPNPGYVGTDTFTYRGAGTPASPGTLFGEDRTVTVTVMPMGVTTVPGAPLIGIATPAGGRATISFTANADDGGSPVTGFTVSCDPGGTPVTATGTSSPILVNGLTDGVFYFCSVTATNAQGTSAPSATADVIPQPNFLGAYSRKTHGLAGALDITIDTTQPIGGSVTTEPRASDAGGVGHKLVFMFDGPITVPGNPQVMDAGGSPVGAEVSTVANGNNVEVTWSGIPDNIRTTFSLFNVNNASFAFASIGFMLGDVNNTRAIDSSDAGAVRAQAGRAPTSLTVRMDVNATGIISAADIAAVKARSGNILP